MNDELKALLEDIQRDTQAMHDDLQARRKREQDRIRHGVQHLCLEPFTRAVICTNGEVVVIYRPVTLLQVRQIIEATTLDTVVLHDLMHVMLVDDNGQAKGLPVNELATAHYYQKCGAQVPRVIRGDVAIMPDTDYAPIDRARDHMAHGPDLAKIDAHVITQEEYDEIPELTDEMARPAGSNKQQMNLRIDVDVIDAYRSQGDGWQTRMNDALRDYAESHGMLRK